MRIKKFKFYAYRDNKGATGGPGGVLYLQKKILKEKIDDIPIEYVFKSNNKYLRKLKGNYKGAILQVIKNELFTRNIFYIANDIATAFALAIMGKKYSLIYHQQGPIIEELTNFNVDLNRRQKVLLRLIEKIAFRRAHAVHFPSKGAEKMYFESSYRTVNFENVVIGEVLPNTIEININHNNVEYKRDTLTFFSVGTLTKAKGQDQFEQFFKTFLSLYHEKTRLILVGQGPLQREIVDGLNKVKKEYLNFEYQYFPVLSHEEIMRLHQMADIYIMLHRISIFDMATLEAMSQNTAIVLSKVGGNIDFNKKHNIILVENYTDTCKELLSKNLDELKKINLEVFEEFFSEKAFFMNYRKLLKGLIKEYE